MAGAKTLLKAVTTGRTRQVRLLLDLGASTENTDECGQTPLIRAVFVASDRNRDKIIKMLLKKGSVVSKADVVGRNALSWACMYGRDKDVATLLEYADVDIDLNKSDINGQTALFHAVSSGNAATVKMLVNALQKYGLSVDIPDSSGVSPLMHANRLGYDICASILIHEGNAKVGLSHNNSDKSSRVEKWAITSLRERSRAKKSQFPPIANRVEDTLLKSRIGRRRQPRKVSPDVNVDSDSSVDEEYVESLLLRNQSNFNENASPRANAKVRNCLQNIAPSKIPPSILRSPVLSSLCNVSSDNDSEVDSVASTITDGRTVRATLDLPSMYEFYQEQITSSFRHPAKRAQNQLPEPLGVLNDDEYATENDGRKKEKG